MTLSEFLEAQWIIGILVSIGIAGGFALGYLARRARR